MTMILRDEEHAVAFAEHVLASMIEAMQSGNVVRIASKIGWGFLRSGFEHQWTIEIDKPNKNATYAISPENLVTTAAVCLQFGEESE